ncbi:hypothetical protein IM511_11000 [Erythrobacteraceae bacterium E2-1 Yellow Sea]|nr:hypothetical protein [Erythrobacteraceae bacterium E2-1 Yellow Sea]
MKINRKKWAFATAAGAAAVLAAPVMADHSWGSYHWSTTDNVVRIPVFDHTSGVWKNQSPLGNGNYIKVAMDDWNQSDHIASQLSNAAADSTCSMVAYEIHVCSGNYGDNGWLGIASISISRGRSSHIVAGSTKLNDYYFDVYTVLDGSKPYDDPSWRQLVACQEIGHDYGLGHQNEDFDTDDTTSCMEYTYDPTLNEHPNSHDYDQLALIYGHDGGDGGTTDPSPGPGNKGGKNKIGIPGNAPAEWGQAIGFDANGRPNVYRRSTASYDFITHVTWAPHTDFDHDHEEAGPRRHSGERIFPGG